MQKKMKKMKMSWECIHELEVIAFLFFVLVCSRPCPICTPMYNCSTNKRKPERKFIVVFAQDIRKFQFPKMPVLRLHGNICCQFSN